MTGKQSLLFDKDVYVRCTATVVGKKEADGPLGEMFDVAVEDDMFGKKSWEEAESHIQEMAVDKLLIKSGMAASDIDYIYAGDLLGQLIATSFGLMRYEIPMFGLYGSSSVIRSSMETRDQLHLHGQLQEQGRISSAISLWIRKNVFS